MSAPNAHRPVYSVAYTYVGLPMGCGSVNAPVYNCTPSVAGVFRIRVFANDCVGQSGTAVMVLTITALLGLPPTTFYELVRRLFLTAAVILLGLAVLQERRQRGREGARRPANRTRFSRAEDADGPSSELRGDSLDPPPGN